ncbi:serine-rich adhesin for platelets-like [Melanerpes formicivorus]|uniref:serine-rich adhesin for platelets-like n=1 Tax=Melanerpes formicivorus TaxID=211600 RepID=UPI00358E8DE0
MAAIRKYKLRVGIVDIDEKTLENRENTASETGNESIPTHLPHTSILHPQIGAAENKESMEVAEKRTNERGDNDRGQMRTKQSDDTVQASRKRKLDDNETPTEQKVQKLNTGNESIPIPGSHAPILHPGGEAPQNKERIKMAEKRRTNQSDNAVKGSPKQKLDNNEKTAEKKENTTSETGNESIPTLLSHTLILNPRGDTSDNEAIIKTSETKRTNERDDNDVNTLGHSLELDNNEKTDEKSSNESIPNPPSNTFIFIKEEPELREMSEEKATSESSDDDDMTRANLPCELVNDKTMAEQEEITTAESDNESIPTSLSHTLIPSPGSGAAENKEVAEKTSSSESDEDVILVRVTWDLQNYKNPAKEKENTTAEMGNESIPTHLPHTSILHPQTGAVENKKSMKKAEKRTNKRGDNDRGQMRTKQSDDTVQASRKRKLEDDETPTKKKVKMLNTGKESIPPPVSHTPILSPGSGAAENKEIAEKKRTNEIDDNDVNILGHNFELENNEKADEKSSNESIPNPPSNTFIFMKGEPQLREMSEEKATSESSDDDDMTIANLPCELLNDKTMAEHEEITTAESDNESTLTSLSHTLIPSPGSGAAENKEVAEKTSSSESDEDVILVRVTWDLQNYKNPAKEKEITTAESDNESIPTSPSHTPILSPGCGAAENKEVAETTSSSESDEDVGTE